MALSAVIPSTIMGSTTVGQAPKGPAPLLCRRPEAAFRFVDEMAAVEPYNLAPTLMEDSVLTTVDGIG